MFKLREVDAGDYVKGSARLNNEPDGHALSSVLDDTSDVVGSGPHNAQQSTGLQHIQPAEKRVAVILGYFEGEDYIRDQVESILSQTHQALHLYICDDQSVPRFEVSRLYMDQDQSSRVSVAARSSNLGSANNFLDALANVSDDFEYFAFSVQDDVWYADKLERAIAALEDAPPDMPAIYCARTEISDESCQQTLGYSPRFDKRPSFANALVQNIGGGDTMLFNQAARDLILNAAGNVNVVSHDWWCYQIVTGAGGYVVYDPKPCLKYRQHTNNLVGANTSWRSRLVRIRDLLRGRLRAWNDINLNALSEHAHLLTTDNQKVLNDFIEERQSPLIKRFSLFKRCGIYRQTVFGSLGLLLGIVLNKV